MLSGYLILVNLKIDLDKIFKINVLKDILCNKTYLKRKNDYNPELFP